MISFTRNLIKFVVFAMKYTKDHEWVKFTEGNVCYLGITNHASEALGTLVYVELPSVGAVFKKGDSCCVVESAKSASDVYCPFEAKVIGVNGELSSSPEFVNQNQEGENWILKLEVISGSDSTDFMTKEDYYKLIA
jgi:glycine cleavage system H protein